MAKKTYDVRPWLAEFADPAVEGDYRSEQFRLQRSQVRLALLVWAGLWLLFVLDDYLRTGGQSEFTILLMQRLIVFGAILAFAAILPRWPAMLTDSHGLAVLMIIGWTGYLSLYFLMPAEAVPWTFGMGMVMLVSLFVFLPIRLPHALGVALYSIGGTAVVLFLSQGVQGARLVSAVGAMLVPMITGMSVLHRLHSTQRRQYALLLEAQDANRDLTDEIAIRQELEEQLRLQATTDPLTGVYNRRHYEELICREIRRARRNGSSLALCLLDIDHFKQVNDIHGHGVGDEVLKFLGRLCRETVRETDIVGRFGGEEFVVALPETGLADALAFSERLRERLESAEIPTANGSISVTITIGAAELSDKDASLKDLTHRADEALYAGKHWGRNQVRAAA